MANKRDWTDLAWIEETEPSTSIPEIIAESNAIGTVIIFVFSALVTITLLFVIAIFIDCRQQKLIDFHQQKKTPKQRSKLKIPKIGLGRAIREDESSIVDRMQHCEPNVLIV